MSNKEIFISEISDIIEKMKTSTGSEVLSEEAMNYFNDLKYRKEKVEITETGIKILKLMQEENAEFYLAKTIGEGLFISSRSASGALRKLTEDGFCEKTGKDPVHYSLTEKGKNKKFD